MTYNNTWVKPLTDKRKEEIKKLLSITVEKQLPITDEAKAAILELRRQMFWDHTDDLAEQLYTGEISIGQWQETFKDQMRQFYASSAAIGKGGWDNMTNQDWGRLGPVMKEQYRYLQGFADHIDNNRDTISLKYIKSRAKLYGEGGAYGAALIQAGVTFTDKLPWIPRDGSTECLNRCHCHWSNAIVERQREWMLIKSTWRLGEADHCSTCIKRNGYEVYNRVPEHVEVPSMIGGY